MANNDNGHRTFTGKLVAYAVPAVLVSLLAALTATAVANKTKLDTMDRRLGDLERDVERLSDLRERTAVLESRLGKGGR